MPSAYLDHAASTPMRPEARDALLDVLDHAPGNPSGQHRWAREARRRLDDARDGIAALLGVSPAGVVFTSGGTEADNLAILGARSAGLALCSAIEHHAVLDSVISRAGSTVAVDSAGRIDLEHLEAELAAERSISLVSVMLANNEIGTIQDLDAVAEVLDRARPSHPHGLRLHTDAVAAAAWVDVAALAARADLITISGHKVGAPKGIGVLAHRDGIAVVPQMIGGAQERGARPGTPNLAGAVAMHVALAVTARERSTMVDRVQAQADRLVAGLTESVDHVRSTVPRGSVDAVANIVHLSCREVESEALLYLLDEAGVAASAGSSCASGALEPSHVVDALGVAPDWAPGALRLSLGWSTTDDEIDHALAVIPPAIDQLRHAGEPAA